MKGQRFYRVADLALELAPAALLNFAVAFSLATLLRHNGLAEFSATASVAAGIAAFLLARHLLRRAGRAAGGFRLPQFDNGAIAVERVSVEEEEAELLLTDALEADDVEQQPPGSELLLDDIIESIGPESRVVRLFDPQRMPTAGEMQARIDRHLLAGRAPPAPPDASQALHEAIEELRRSLR